MARTAEEKRLAKNASSAAWRARNPGHMAKVTRAKALLAVKAWQAANPEKLTQYKADYAKGYNKQRRQVDPLFKLLGNTRCLINISFKKRGWSKTSKTQVLLGCTFEAFVVYLQSKFKEGMTLENHGE